MIAQFSREVLRRSLMDDDVFNEVFARRKQAFVFGKVLYKDVMGPPNSPIHETRWICSYVPGNDMDLLYLIEGPDEYMKHT